MGVRIMGKAAVHNGKSGFLKGTGRTAVGSVLIVAVLWLTSGCSGNEKLNKDVETLKAEVATLKEKVDKLEATEKVLMEMVRIKTAAPQAGATPAPAPPGASGTAAELPGLPSAPAQTSWNPMTLDELFRNRDSLLGTRVTVRGLPGPVMMHKKTLFMNGPGGMVEVIYGNLQDKKQVDRLTAQNIDTPITVSGILSAAPGQSPGQVRLIIMADSVEF
jgi:outer membrane murein-binding lipoprotein Lpp